MAVHPTAIVDSGAEIDATAEIGAYAVVEGGVRIGPETRVYPHAYIAQGTTLGRGCQIHPFAVVGHLPQDVKYDGSPSYTQVGDGTIVREHASIHRGTIPGSTTIVGQRCFIMATAHIAHNCVVGDDVTMVNAALLAGHVQVGARAFFGGGAGVHQFVRVGELAMVKGHTAMPTDVPPFMVMAPAGVVAPNIVGLRRAGFTADERMEIHRAYKTLYRSGLLFRKAIERVAETVETAPGRRLVDFLRAESRRGITGFKKAVAATAAPTDA